MIEKTTTITPDDILWLRPLFTKDTGISLNLMDISLDALMKINEYIDIRDAVENFYTTEVERMAKQQQ